VNEVDKIMERTLRRGNSFLHAAWLGKFFQMSRWANISSRQEVFFFGIPAGDYTVCAPALPTWLFQERPGVWNAGHRGTGIKDCV